MSLPVVLLLSAAACGRDATTTTGSGGSATTAPAPRTGATAVPGRPEGIEPAPPGAGGGSSGSTGSGHAPTTGAADPSDPDGVVSSPPLDPAPPYDDSTMQEQPKPDAAHGVVRGQSGGSACPKSADVCNAMYRFVPAMVTLTGPETMRIHTTDVPPIFGFAVLLTPGHYTVTAAPDNANDECDPTTVDVAAGETVDVSISCWPRS